MLLFGRLRAAFEISTKMASHHDDDTMPEQTEGYKLSQPKQSLAEYHQMGMLSSSFPLMQLP